MALIGVSEECKQYIRALRIFTHSDLLIVPGTGLLTDAYFLSSWGPYSLFKWSLMAKLRRSRVMFVSVGAGPIYTRLGRFLVKSTLALADYRSYRDDSSLTCVEAIGFARRQDKVYPDLTFSLPKALIPSAGRPEGRRIVGLGLMSYAGRYSAADPREEIYSNYLDSLAAFVESLLERDYSVRLLLGDEDSEVIDEFRDSLKARLGDYDATRVIHEPAAAVEQILEQIAGTDVVVATRFHNLLLALLLGKPAMAISFHSKCVSLMSQFGLSNYCQDIDGLSAERLIAQFEDVELNHAEITTMIQRSVDGFRGMLDEQYDNIFGGSSRTLVCES